MMLSKAARRLRCARLLGSSHHVRVSAKPSADAISVPHHVVMSVKSPVCEEGELISNK